MKEQRAHPGAEAIAASMGGVRTWRARRVAAHIAACPSCSAQGRQIGQVSVVLAAVPPPPLPGDLALRLDAALAAEVAARAASGSVMPDGQSRHRQSTPPWAWRVLRPVPVLAALTLCLVLAGGGYLLSQSGGTGNVPGTSAQGAASAPRNMSPAVARPGAIPGPVGTAPAANYEVRNTNIDYLPATLRVQAQLELTSLGSSKGTVPSDALRACVLEVAGSDSGKVTFVDLARYEGRPATIIVAKDHAWVTSRDCNATQHKVLDEVSLPGG